MLMKKPACRRISPVPLHSGHRIGLVPGSAILVGGNPGAGRYLFPEGRKSLAGIGMRDLTFQLIQDHLNALLWLE